MLKIKLWRYIADCESSKTNTQDDHILFHQVTPVYESSLEALSAVKLNDILEVMKYREPPQVLAPLFKVMCMLFDREERYSYQHLVREPMDFSFL